MDIEDHRLDQRVLDNLEKLNNNILDKQKSFKKTLDKGNRQDIEQVLQEIKEQVNAFEENTQGHNYEIPMSLLLNLESDIDTKDWLLEEYVKLSEMSEHISYKKKKEKLRSVVDILDS